MLIKRCKRCRWILLPLALCASIAGVAAQCRLVQSPAIPVTMMGWRPTIPAELDGHKTRLLVDTGAFFDTLSPAEAAEFHLPLSSAPYGLYITGGLGNLVPKIATIKSLKVGPLSFGDATFLVAANDLGNGISGVLGQNLYRVLDVEFDFANGVMRFYHATDCARGSMAYWANATAQSVSVLKLEERQRSNPHLLGTVLVNGHAINAIFDTGAPTSLLSLAAARVAGVAPGSAGQVPVGTSGKLWSAPIDEIEIGNNEKIEHTHILVQDENFWFGPGVWMFIGADFFLSHRVYLATSQSKLYFTYNGGPVFDLNPADAAQSGQRPADATAALSHPTPPDADDLMRRGVARADRLQFQQAIADLTEACRMAPRNGEYRYQRGIVYWRYGQPIPALQDFDTAVELDPADFQARLWRAEMQLIVQTGRTPDPQAEGDPRIELSSVDRPASKEHARSGEAGPKTAPKIADGTEGAKADLDAVDRQAPAEADLRLTLGRVYEDIGQYGQAIHQYDLWIANHAHDDRLAVALTWRCGSRVQGNVDVDQGLKDCNQAYGLMGVSFWSSKPRWPASWIAPLLSTRSLADLRRGNIKGAIADDDAAIKLQPTDADAFYARGIAELREGLETAGKTDLAAARRLQPGIDARYASMGLAP